MRLHNRVAIVTGGASGIGEATALRFCEEGAKVIVTDIQEPAKVRVVDELTSKGYEASYYQADVTREDDWIHLINFTKEKYGRLDILFNNAGNNHHGEIVDVLLEDWSYLINLNLTGVFLGCKHSLPLMIASGGNGSIINNASSLGIITMSGIPAYSASKGGVISLTRQVALDYAARGIRVNCICPGPVRTPRIERYIQQGKSHKEAMLAKVPMGRLAEPAEIAATVAFLASDDASFITGAAIVVDGGQTIH